MSGPVWAVVLAGGHGTRFWPLSTSTRPKQLLPLVTAQPMLRETLDRIAPLTAAERTLVLTSGGLAASVRALAPQIPAANVVVEPKPAGTAAALAWAAHQIATRGSADAVMISVHADWAVHDVPKFRAALSHAAEAASRERALVTVGIHPTHPDPGLGYIQPGAGVAAGLFRVARFIEKPDVEGARALIAGGALWNSGIFAWRVGDLLDEVRAVCPEVGKALAAHGNNAERFFDEVQPIAIDKGVLERSARVMVIPGDFGWSDVGTWSALREVRALDPSGNSVSGPAFVLDARGNVIHAEGVTAVVYGTDDLVVVALDGITLVTTVARARDLKTLVDSLPREIRDR